MVRPPSTQANATDRLMQTPNIMTIAFRLKSSGRLYLDLARHHLELGGLAQERLPGNGAAFAGRHRLVAKRAVRIGRRDNPDRRPEMIDRRRARRMAAENCVDLLTV